MGVVPFSQENAPKIFGGNIKEHLLIFSDTSDEEAHKKVVEAVQPEALARRGSKLFVTIDKTDDRIMEFFGVQTGDLPTVRMVKMEVEGMKKYKMTEAMGTELTAASVKTFIEAYDNGELS